MVEKVFSRSPVLSTREATGRLLDDMIVKGTHEER